MRQPDWENLRAIFSGSPWKYGPRRPLGGIRVLLPLSLLLMLAALVCILLMPWQAWSP